MRGINSSVGSNVRLWAVERKENLLRPFIAFDDSHTRHNRPFGAAATTERKRSPTAAEMELATRHFDDQHLDPGESKRLAAALLHVVNNGGTFAVGPVGRRRRRYEICRQLNGISIRSGEGRILLPPTGAVRLAGLINRSHRAGMARDSA